MSIKVIILFFVLSLAGVPMAVALGLASVVVLAFYSPFPLQIVPQTLVSSMDSFIMVAVPLFILAGNLMETGGMSQRIFSFANLLVGRWTGGLGHVNVLASMIFGGISGSSVADTASLGPIEIRAMTSHGYPKGYAAAISVASSTLSSIIPPSILMIVAGTTAGQSVGQLLTAGLGPGLLMTGMLMAANYVISRRRGYGQPTKVTGREAWRAGLSAIPAVVAPVIILAGILGGFFTPTEASAIATVYAILVGMLYRELRWADLPQILLRTARTSGTILFIAVTAKLATWIFTIDGLPAQLANFIMGISSSPTVIILLVIVLLTIVGMFMDVMAALLILVPILFPTMTMVGLHPLHTLIIIVCTLTLGLITPPVGVCLYAIANVAGMSIEEVTKEVWPLLLVLVAAVVLVGLVPAISLFPVRLLWG